MISDQNDKGGIWKAQEDQNSPTKVQLTKYSPRDIIATPPFSSRLKHFTKDYEETLKMRMKKQTVEGNCKWIFKTQMKVISGPTSGVVRQAFQQNLTLSKIKAYTHASEANLAKALAKFDEKKSKINQLLEKMHEQTKKNQWCKKMLLHYDAQRNRTLLMLQKCESIDLQINQTNTVIYNTENLITQTHEQIKNFLNRILWIRQKSQLKVFDIEELQRIIEGLASLLKQKIQENKQLSITKMPNQKQITSNMFLIGILNEQLYILELQQSLKSAIFSQELEPKKIDKDNKQKDQPIKRLSTAKFSQHLSNRIIHIDCENSSITTFKVFTVIYMHCRSLSLSNIISIMRKTSYFSDQFKILYQYEDYEKYMNILIENYKGNNENNLKSESSKSKKSNFQRLKLRVNIVTNEMSIKYLQWILQCFNQNNNIYVFEIGSMNFELELHSIEDLINTKSGNNEQLQLQSKPHLRIVFHELDSDFIQ